MALFDNFDLAGSAMSAQSLRLNITASNMANANTLAGDKQEVYKARHPVFKAVMLEAQQHTTGVKMAGVLEDETEALAQFSPGHPLADEEGYVYSPNISVVEEMVNMMSASRSFQANVEVLNTTKQMLQRTLSLGQ
ncbi:MAG: flagellar basal body rod protein FlgC [Granulosicoccaceae bacterium]